MRCKQSSVDLVCIGILSSRSKTPRMGIVPILREEFERLLARA